MSKKFQSSRKKKGTSTLSQHKKQGKKLLPPMLSHSLNWNFSSWSNVRLPEMLWAALLVTDIGRDHALQRFREIANFVFHLPEASNFCDITHTGIATLPHDIATQLVGVICSDAKSASALTPLLLLDSLPSRDLWESSLCQVPEKKSWSELSAAVFRCYDHQSQDATDCRWIKILVRLVSGYLQLPSEEMIRQIAEYPNFGDIRKVRPSIRANEISFASDEPKSDWPEAFWRQCFNQTECYSLEMDELETRKQKPTGKETDSVRAAVTERAKRIWEVYRALGSHAITTATTSDIDAKHDTVFGTGLYALIVLQEICSHRLGTSVSGRLGLRVLLECYVTLAYLIKKAEPELWRSYRVYGAGQAKLALLKFQDAEDIPASLDLHVLENLVNEDAWEEFLPIDLGHWAKANLRQISEDAEVKDEYDRYYPWPSTFIHGQWGAQRDTVFDNCINPLHRFHRIPRFLPRQLPDVMPDAIKLTDKILDLIAKEYPEFKARVGSG